MGYSILEWVLGCAVLICSVLMVYFDVKALTSGGSEHTDSRKEFVEDLLVIVVDLLAIMVILLLIVLVFS